MFAMSRGIILTSALLLLCLATSCTHRIPKHQISVVPLTQPSIPPHPSTIPVTFAMDLSPLIAEINRVIPGEMRDKGTPYQDAFGWVMTRKATSYGIDNGRFVISADFDGYVEGKGSWLGIKFRPCKLEPFLINATLSFEPSVSQAGSDYYLEATNVDVKVRQRPGSDRKCTIFNIDVGGPIGNLLNSQGIKSAIESAVTGKKFRLPFAESWKRLSGPFSVTLSPSVAACIYPTPTELAIGRVGGTVAAASITMQLAAMPGVLIAKACTPASIQPIRISSRASVQKNFSVAISVAVEYRLFDALLNEKLGNESILLGRKQLNIAKIETANADGRTLVAIDVTGYIDGRIYFWGTPTLNGRGDEISFPDLELALESRNLLSAIKGAIAGLSSKFRDRLRTEARIGLNNTKLFPSGNPLEVARKKISNNYDAGGLTLSLDLQRVVVSGVASQSVSSDGAGGTRVPIFVVTGDLEGTAMARGKISDIR